MKRPPRLALLLLSLPLAVPPIAKAEAPLPRRDSYGDPVPEGALARIGTLRFRHPMPWCVAFSPDGKVLASGGYDNAVRLWDPDTGEQLRHLAGHTSYVESIAYSSDGKILAAGSHNGEIRLWDPATGKELRVLRGHKSGVDGVAFSPDGKRLASGSMDNTVRVWDVGTGKELRQLGSEKPGHYVHTVAFSPDGQLLAAGGTENAVFLWDVATWKERAPLRGHQDRINTLAFTPDSKTIATCSFDKTVRLWDVAAGEEKRRIATETEYVRCLALSADGKRLAAGDVKGTLAVWDLESGRAITRWRFGADLTSLAFSPDGKKLASASPALGVVRLWDPLTGKRLNPTTEAEDRVDDLALSPDGKRLAGVTGGWHSTRLRLWDTATRKEVWRKDTQDSWTRLAFAPDGRVFASGHTAPAAVRLWDAATGEARACFLPKGHCVGAMTYSPRGDRLAFLCDRIPVLWDPATGEEVSRLKDAPASQDQLAYSPDGRLVAFRGERWIVSAWDVKTAEKVHDYGREEGWGRFLTFSPDGQTLAAPCRGADADNADKEVGLWETATGGERCRLKGHRGQVLAGAFSPDGRLLATAGEGDEAIFLWDPLTGRLRRRLTGHRGWVRGLAFSADGKRLVSGGDDTTVLIWDAAALTPVRPRPADKLGAARLATLWDDLAAANAAKGYQAIAVLAGHPAEAGPFLRDRLRAAPAVDGKRMRRLIADLDADDFEVREKASEELARLGQLAEPALKEALEGKPSAEVTERARRLLGKLKGQEWPPERLRTLRVAEVLERVGTPAACDALRALAEGGADSELVRQAKAALERLDRARGRADSPDGR